MKKTIFLLLRPGLIQAQTFSDVVKIAESANTATLWTATANTLPAIPFTSPIFCKAGICIAAIIYNNSAQTTAPAIASATALANANMASMDNTNSAKLFGTTSAQNTLPATQLFSGIAAATAPTFIEVY